MNSILQAMFCFSVLMGIFLVLEAFPGPDGKRSADVSLATYDLSECPPLVVVDYTDQNVIISNMRASMVQDRFK